MIRKRFDFGGGKQYVMHSFLINLSQYVHVSGQCSRVFISTGAPLGCVLSPLLYTLLSNSCIMFSRLVARM